MKRFLRKFKDPKYLLGIAIVAAVYYAAALFGQSLSYSTDNVSLFWPATGIALATLVVFGIDLWPGIAIGAFASTVTTQPSPLVAFGMSTGITLEAVGATFMLGIFGFKSSFERAKDVFIFIIFAAVLSTMISATLGALSLVSGGVAGWNNFPIIWKNWWVGDFLGDMIVAPVLLVWSRIGKFQFKAFDVLEGFLFFLVVTASSIALFTGTFPIFTFDLQVQFKYLIFPLLIFASYRFKQKGSTLTVLLITAISVYGVLTGSGPFVMTGQPETSLLYLGVFSAAISLTFMVFSVIIEERDSAEKNLLEREKRFKSLIENSSDVIVLIDAKGFISYTSPSTYKVLQYNPEELIGTSSFDRIYSEDKSRLIKLFQQLVARPEKPIEATFRLVRKDQSIIWVDGIGTNLLADPSVSSIILNYRDVTERQKLDEVKTEFVFLSAHQLRSPLSIIRWYSESLMKEKDLPPKLMGDLAELHNGVVRMASTVNLILDVSRFEMGTVYVSSEPVNLDEIIDTILADNKKTILDNKLSLTKVYKSKIPEIMGDPKLIKIIIENLVSNAIKYTRPGGKIQIDLTPQKDNILFKISDNGLGIPVEDQSKIFTKLFRGDNVRKVVPNGLGLGLYLVRQVIDLKGGKIWFESEEGKGTTFFVEFPLKIKAKKRTK